MKGGTSDMLIEKTLKIEILKEVWAGIEEKAKKRECVSRGIYKNPA